MKVYSVPVLRKIVKEKDVNNPEKKVAISARNNLDRKIVDR